MLDKSKTFLRAISFERSEPNAEGLITVTVNASIGDGEQGENMGCEYQCRPDQIREVQRIGTIAMLDLAEDFLANDTRVITCMKCGASHKLLWTSIVTPEDQCAACEAVGTKTTEPRFVTQFRRVPNPKLMQSQAIKEAVNGAN